MKKKRREISVRNEPYIYKIEVREDSRWVRKCFRVQKKVRTMVGTRKTVSETFPNLAEARKYRDQIKTLTLEEVTRLNRPAKKPKFQEVFRRFIDHKSLEAGLQPSTIQKYQQTGRHLAFFNAIDFENIDSQVVDAWANFLRDPEYRKLQKGPRINYRHEYDLFRGVISYFIEFENEEYTSPLRKRHYKRLCSRPKNSKKEVRFLSVDQQEELICNLEVFKEGTREETLALMMQVQLETGMRIGEVAALQPRQINFRKKEIRIEQHLQWDRSKWGKITLAKGTKSGATRVVYISRACERALRKACPHEFKSSKVFAFEEEWMSYRKIQYFYRKQLEKVGSLSLGSHTLRHTFAVNFLRKTKDIHALQRLLGHADLEATQIYAKYTDESTRRAFEIFDGNVIQADFGIPGSQSGSHAGL